MDKAEILQRLKNRSSPREHQIDTLSPGDLRRLYKFVRARAQEIPKPFSLCQIDWTQSEKDWLRRWPQEVSSGTVRSALDNAYPDDGFSPSDALGLTLLLVAAELGREFAVSGEIWPVVRRQFSDSVQKVIFSEKHPRQSVRYCLESACRRLDLRHAFDLEAVQSYYLTIYLQFGFGRLSLTRLPLWLDQSQDRPKSVQILLDECHEFSALWSNLALWVQGRASLQDLEAIKSSPFIPPEWLPTIAAAESSRAIQSFRFEWLGSSQPDAVIDLSALFCDEEDGAYFLRQADDTQLFIKQGAHFSPECYALALAQSRITLSLAPVDGSCAPETRSLALWDEDLDFQLVDPARGISLKRVPQGRFWLIIREDYQVSQSSRWVQLAHGRKLYEFAGAPGGSFVRGPDGWIDLNAAPASSPLQNAELDLIASASFKLPESVYATVRQIGVPMERCRFFQRGVPVPVEVDPALGFPELHLSLPIETDRAELNLTVRASHEGRTYVKSLSRPICLRAATWLSPDGWAPFAKIAEIEASEMAYCPVRLFYPAENYAVIEGSTISTRPENRDQFFKQLAGYGQPLTLRNGPYIAQESEIILAHSVVNRGKLTHIERNGGSFSLSLREEFEPDENAFLLWWDGNSKVRVSYLDNCDLQGKCISGLLPPGFRVGPVCVALGYGRTRQGCVWTETLDPPEVADWEFLGQLLRWLQLPLLQSVWWSRWGKSLQNNWTALVQAWSKPDPCVFDGQETQHPDRVEFGDLFRRVVAGVKDIPATPASKLLCGGSFLNWVRIAPRFAVQLMRSGNDVRLSRAALFQFFEVQGPRDLNEKCQRAAKDMRVDSNFVESLGDAFCRDKIDRKLDLALTQATFQDYAICRALGGDLWRD